MLEFDSKFFNGHFGNALISPGMMMLPAVRPEQFDSIFRPLPARSSRSVTVWLASSRIAAGSDRIG